jgi:hypothetical protein
LTTEVRAQILDELNSDFDSDDDDDSDEDNDEHEWGDVAEKMRKDVGLRTDVPEPLTVTAITTPPPFVRTRARSRSPVNIATLTATNESTTLNFATTTTTTTTTASTSINTAGEIASTHAASAPTLELADVTKREAGEGMSEETEKSESESAMQDGTPGVMEDQNVTLERAHAIGSSSTVPEAVSCSGSTSELTTTIVSSDKNDNPPTPDPTFVNALPTVVANTTAEKSDPAYETDEPPAPAPTTASTASDLLSSFGRISPTSQASRGEEEEEDHDSVRVEAHIKNIEDTRKRNLNDQAQRKLPHIGIR